MSLPTGRLTFWVSCVSFVTSTDLAYCGGATISAVSSGQSISTTGTIADHTDDG